MPTQLAEADFRQLKQALPGLFQDAFEPEDALLAQAYPLLDKLCLDRALISRLEAHLGLPAPSDSTDGVKGIVESFQGLQGQWDPMAPLKYRLPVVLSEFPIHSRAINQAIQGFNEQIEVYHQGEEWALEPAVLEARYEAVLTAIQTHGVFCDGNTLWQLLGMMAGWSRVSPLTLLQQAAGQPAEEPAPLPPQQWPDRPIIITEQAQPAAPLKQNPFAPDYHYRFNGAGRLADETELLLLNAFGMKIGGHFDAQVKTPPRFMPLEQLHALIRRQLSHRLQLWPGNAFEALLEEVLYQLGVAFIAKNEQDLSKDMFISPFLTKPISFLSPEKIQSTLNTLLPDFESDAFNPSEQDIAIIAQYLFELLQGFQFNPGQALGIGANWDGTVNLANEAGTLAFTIMDAAWGRRFKQLSLHRQGPSEAGMNAAIGLEFETKALLSSFEYMSQLQPSEYPAVIYNALIDNLVASLLPDPAYFENDAYTKYAKQHVVRRTEEGGVQIEHFLQPNPQGTYIIDRNNGNVKQTPLNRQAGTLDVRAFPKNTTYCEQFRDCYAGNPLGPMQLQDAQARHRSTRGHIVYDPLAADQFLEDAFFGQVQRGDNGDFLPYIGVIPKNYDRHFNQDKELCASFVMRMLQSARMMEYCPTFRNVFEQCQTHFLPAMDSELPALPAYCSPYLQARWQVLQNALHSEERTFSTCHRHYFSLFKNLIYSLYDLGRADEHFKHGFLSLVQAGDPFAVPSRANAEKLLRELTINRPVDVSPQALSRYDETLTSLRAVTAYFYPRPSDALAQEIARVVRQQVQPLLQTDALQHYFKAQRQNRQANLSRTQTPGMLYAALKHDGPSPTVVDDYAQMHNEHFPSYYRDPDGTPTGEPQWVDRLLDGAAKALGAGLQVMHRYQLFGVVRKPLTSPVLCARENAARQPQKHLKPLWAVAGAIKGFFWNGIVKGLWQTLTTPFRMLADFFSWAVQSVLAKSSPSLPNPLAIPAAPANAANPRAQAAANTRDFLLHWLGTPADRDIKKAAVRAHALRLVRSSFPQLTDAEALILEQSWQADFPLADNELDSLFEPLLPATEEAALSQLLHQHHALVNKSLIMAVFRCLTNPLYAQQPAAIIDQTQTFFSLNAEQKNVLTKLLQQIQRVSLENKPRVLDWFRFNGLIHRALQTRDKMLQRLQSFVLQGLDEQWLQTRLHPNQEPALDAAPLPGLPLSVKEAAHLKWKRFAERELKHQLISQDESNELFAFLAPYLNDMTGLQSAFQSLDSANEESINTFYVAVNACIQEIEAALEQSHSTTLAAAQTLLLDCRNITMNAIVNSRLASADIFSPSLLVNPLSSVTAIAAWLADLQQDRSDLRSLLEQQIQQSPSLDHALWAYKCILQSLETQNGGQKITKTGLQGLLRFWSKHQGNVTMTGEAYINPQTGEANRIDQAALFEDCVTLQQAMVRVKDKLPSYSLFRTPGKIGAVSLPNMPSSVL